MSAIPRAIVIFEIQSGNLVPVVRTMAKVTTVVSKGAASVHPDDLSAHRDRALAQVALARRRDKEQPKQTLQQRQHDGNPAGRACNRPP